MHAISREADSPGNEQKYANRVPAVRSKCTGSFVRLRRRSHSRAQFGADAAKVLQLRSATAQQWALVALERRRIRCARARARGLIFIGV